MVTRRGTAATSTDRSTVCCFGLPGHSGGGHQLTSISAKSVTEGSAALRLFFRFALRESHRHRLSTQPLGARVLLSETHSVGNEVFLDDTIDASSRFH